MKYDVPRTGSGWMAWSIGACLLLSATVGCGGDEVPRAPVSGTVTLNGKPLKEGVILFTPLNQGPSAGGDIQQGKYQLAQDRGPSPGKYRVEIRAYRSTGKTTRDAATGTVREETVSIIPFRYNSQSTLQADVQPEGVNTFDFQLTSG